MKKLKLLFPLLGTSAIVVAPALSAQTNRYNDPPDPSGNEKRVRYDNNNKLFLAGKTTEYYYDFKTPDLGYTEGNFNFTLTSYGTAQLAKAKMASSASTGQVIMTFLDKNLLHFDNLYKYSYLNEVEGTAPDKFMRHYTDGYAWSKFANSMGQPATQVDKFVTLLKQGVPLPQVAVRFHYDWHTFASNDFDVSFSDNAVTPIAPGYDWNGHFPGMGPYGPKGDQDAATAIGNDDMFTLTFDLSTRSIKWINQYYISDNRASKNDTPANGIYDFLTDAYPSGAFTADLYELNSADDPAISTIMNAMVQYIGTHRTNGQLLLNLKPGFEIIAKNQPSGVQYQATHQW